MGLNIKLASLAALGSAAYGILGNGAVSTSAPYFNGEQLKTNLMENWLLYLGVPVGVGLAGSVVKGMRANPSLSFGKGFRVAVF